MKKIRKHFKSVKIVCFFFTRSPKIWFSGVKFSLTQPKSFKTIQIVPINPENLIKPSKMTQNLAFLLQISGLNQKTSTLNQVLSILFKK
jgi:hypothetical protein